ncbi:MAG: hypothetical protein HN380_07600 [Victivallales bacterium]|nr:hypothetical protein [Victivallales bacterium]
MAADPVIYPFAPELPKSDAYQVTVGGKEAFVHKTEVTDFASFAIRGATVVEIRCAGPVKRVVVRPLLRGIVPEVEGNTLRFPIDKPGPLSVEINGKIRGTLLLFVDPVETEALRLDAPGMHYFEGGKIHEAGEIVLRDGETLYLGPGAVVRGTVKADNAKNIRILGPGILDGRMRTRKATFMRLNNCQNVEIRDVTVLGSYGWTIVPWGCDGVTLRNVKVFSWRDNDDGLDICSSRNVTVDGCFFRTKDDCIAIKAPRGNRTATHDVKGVTIRNSVFWNAEWGNAMEIGFELRTARIGDIVWRNCDIIRVERGAVFSVHNGDWAQVADILFEDIRIEDARDKLVDLHLGLSIYSTDCPQPYSRSNPKRKPTGTGPWVPMEKLSEAERATIPANRGTIENIVFRKLSLLEGIPPKSYILGFGDPAHVQNVVFSGIRHQDRELTTPADLNLEVRDAQDVRFE